MAKLQLVIEVTAGLAPGDPLPDLTRRWSWTQQDQDLLEHGNAEARGVAQQRYTAIAGESREYAATLENPVRVNWVRRDWIWV